MTKEQRTFADQVKSMMKDMTDEQLSEIRSATGKPSMVELAMEVRRLSVSDRLTLVLDIMNNIPPSEMRGLKARFTGTYFNLKDLVSDHREAEKSNA